MEVTYLDRTQEIDSCSSEIPINPMDQCIYYEKHPSTFLTAMECWTCRYSDFDVEPEALSGTGVCKYCDRIWEKIRETEYV